jgi:hypothetical protein
LERGEPEQQPEQQPAPLLLCSKSGQDNAQTDGTGCAEPQNATIVGGMRAKSSNQRRYSSVVVNMASEKKLKFIEMKLKQELKRRHAE